MIFYKQQISLIDNGKLDEAKLNLKQGKNLVNKFRVTDSILLNQINLEISNSHNKIVNTQIIQRYILIFLRGMLTFINIVFIKFIWSLMYEEVTKKNEINKELQKSIVSQEEFTANISHELKTPLNVIFATAQLFDMYCNSGSLDEKRDAFIKYNGSIKKSCYRLSKLINNIVDSSKIQSGFFGLNLLIKI